MSSPDEKEEEKAAPTATMNEDNEEELANESLVSTIQIVNQEDNATTFHLFDKEHVLGLSSYFYSLYKSKTLTDISVECGTDKFQFHKPVLSYSSGYFSTLFETSPEVSSHKLTFQVEPAMFDILANSFYTGSVFPLTEENALRLLHASYFLKAGEAHDECTAFLQKNLYIDNCLDIWIEARTCCNDVLLKQATAKVGRHLEEVACTDTFLQLDFDQVQDLLSSDGLQVVSEMVVYNAAVGWIKHDLPTRESHLYDVLSVVRFNYLSREFLTETVAEEPLVLSDKDAMSLYLNALQYKLGSPRAKAPASKNRPRRDSFRHSVVGGVERYAKQQQEMALQVVPESKPKWNHWLDVHVVFPWQYFQTNIWQRYIATPVVTWVAFCKQDVLEKRIAGPLSQTREILLPPSSEPSIPGVRQENVIEKWILRPIAESPCIPDSSDEEYEYDEPEVSPIATRDHDSPTPDDDLLHESVWTKISEVATPEKEQTFTAVSVK